MYYPNREKFKHLAAQGNLIPVYKEILADTETPVSAFMKVKGQHSFLLESVEGGEKWARYSILGVSPLRIIKSWGNRVEITERDGRTATFLADDPLTVLRAELDRHVPVGAQDMPRFYGGLVGYLGYEMVRFFERVPDSSSPSLSLPDMFFMVMDTVVIFDNLKQVLKVVANAHTSGLSADEAYDDAIARVDAMVELMKARPSIDSIELACLDEEVAFSSSFTKKEDFMAAVEQCREYIKAGDIFQVVLSQRFDLDAQVDPFTLYRALRAVNPSPYMFYMNMGEAELAGSSPEILVRLEEDRIILRPIAGTRKRGANEDEDRALAQELLADPKERAEHLMLVDLGRNDVGRVARTGTVKVEDFMHIERYSHVMHLVTDVEGILKEGLDAFDLLRATFPAGTVTGAPKVRAMEIINELEPVQRGPYAGAVGYFSYSGNMDTCITIRTLLIKDGSIHVQAGAGIVADSKPELEYEETINKAKAMMRAVAIARNAGRQSCS